MLCIVKVMRLLLPLVCSPFVLVGQAQAFPEEDPGAGMIAPSEEIVLRSESFPTGAAIVGRVECFNCFSGGLPSFWDADGQALMGSFQDVPDGLGDNAFVWLSDAPLSPGSYRATIPGGYAQVDFEVVAENTAAPSLVSEITVAEYGDGESVSCLSYASGATFAVNTSDTMKQGSLRLQMEGEWSQFVYSVSFDEGSSLFFSGASYSTVFRQPTTTCYQVIAQPILGGERSVVGEGCIEAEESADWGLQGEEWGESVEGVLRECTEPPREYFDTWCALLERSSDSGAKSLCDEACQAAQTRCAEGLDPPVDVSDDDGSTDEANGNSQDVSGCTLTGAERGGSLAWAWGGLFFLALSLRRRSLKS